uniref:Uncharacterized protein n=1 Tax=Arundo donax TaxID=35708 RepID=A0A0A8YGM6_ARUDO
MFSQLGFIMLFISVKKPSNCFPAVINTFVIAILICKE